MRYVLSLGLMALVVFSTQSASACSCAPPPPPKKALEAAQAVFLGKVIKIEKPADKKRGFGPITVTFEVSTNYKGVKTKQVKVRTAASGAACGYGFAKDHSYLVYCYSSDKGKTLSTNLCTRTRSKKNATADIKAIGPGNAVKEKSD